MTGANADDLRALTYLAGRIRVETKGAGEWDAAGIHAELKHLIGQNLPITCERVLRHAGDKDAKTPGAIRRPFVPDAPTPGVRHPVKAGEDCRRHVGEDRHACRLCAVEQYGAEGDPTPGDGSEGRALIESIRARREIDHRPTRATTTQGDAL